MKKIKISYVLERKILLPLLSMIKHKLSNETYYKFVMLQRYMLRKIFFQGQITASEEHSLIAFNLYKPFINQNDVVFEIGCGQLGLGVHLMEYLTDGQYIGCDVSPICIKTSLKKIKVKKFNILKPPYIFLNKSVDDLYNLKLSNLNINKFIFNSVFTHFDKNTIEKYLNKLISKYPSAVIYGNISCLKSQENYKIKNNVDFYYSEEFFTNLIKKAGYSISFYHRDNSNNSYINSYFKMTPKNLGN